MASTKPAPANTRFTFGFDVCIMTPPPTLLGFVRGAIDDSPTRQLLLTAGPLGNVLCEPIPAK
jgi:hypothetical protein